MAVNVKDFGALGDGSEASAEIQAAMNSLPNTGGEIFIPSGSYLIDNSLIFINSKNHIKIHLEKDTVLFTQKHGHGIIDITNSTEITIDGGKILGSQNFVDMNIGNENGGGEKHHTSAQSYSWGEHRNSSLTAIGNHNNGYLGNCGIGILIRDGSKNVIINDVEVEGFNYSGFQVQFLGDSETVQKNYCNNIRIISCYIHDIYGSGISVHGSNGVIISNNNIINIGHPDADGSEGTVDPGYGITVRGVKFDDTHAKNTVIGNNNISNCKRRGIDAHSGENILISNNSVEVALIQGIGLQGNTGLRKNAIISNNLISDSGTVSGDNTAKIGIGTTYSETIIQGNIVKNSGYGFGIFNSGSNTTIDSNSIIYTIPTQYQYTSGIRIDGNLGTAIAKNIISNNRIIGDNDIWHGIQIDHLEDSFLEGNMVKTGLSGDALNMANCKIQINNNSWNTFTFNQGNLGKMFPMEFDVLVEYNGGSTPQLKYSNHNEEWFSDPKDVPGGQGQLIQFASNTKNPNVSNADEQLFATISFINKIGAEYVAINPQFSGSKLICHISPKDSSNNLIYSSHSSINGLKFQIKFAIALQL